MTNRRNSREGIAANAFSAWAWAASSDLLVPTIYCFATFHQGGGLCDVDNLRTLCVLCHKDHTTVQAKARAAARRAATAAAAERRDWLEQPAVGAGQEKLRRRVPRTERVFVDEDEEG